MQAKYAPTECDALIRGSFDEIVKHVQSNEELERVAFTDGTITTN
jgi:hypothetical protein